MFYIVYRYNKNIVEIEFVTNDRVVALDKHTELGGVDMGYYITSCKNSRIV